MLEFARIIKYYQPYCGTVYQKFRAGEKIRRKKKGGKKKSIESTRSVTVTGKSNRGRAVKQVQ